MCSRLGVSWRVLSTGFGCETTPDGLNDDRNDVKGYGNGKVRPCGDEAEAAPVLRDHLAGDVVNCGAEEAGCCNSSTRGAQDIRSIRVHSQMMRMEI